MENEETKNVVRLRNRFWEWQARHRSPVWSKEELAWDAFRSGFEIGKHPELLLPSEGKLE
jgi:hypothetical protein